MADELARSGCEDARRYGLIPVYRVCERDGQDGPHHWLFVDGHQRQLQKGFAVHRTETETQVRRVEEAFEALGEDPSRRDNPIVDGLLAEREKFDSRVVGDDLRNVRYLGAALKTERIEITSYEELLTTAEKTVSATP